VVLQACALPKLLANMHCSADPCATSRTERSDLMYVGAGQGEFAVEPAMKYVGYGGDYSVRRGPNACGLVVSSALGLLLLLLGLLIWSDPCYEGPWWSLWKRDSCFDGKDLFWTPTKQICCCRETNGMHGCPVPPETPAPFVQGPVDPYNCALGFLNWQAGWSTEKKQWCCNEHGKGCGHDGPAVANMYDCNDGTENWVKGWSDNKKQWCCSHGYKGCPGDAAMVTGVGYGAGSHGGATPNGAPVFGHEQGFVPFEMATQGTYSNAVPR